MDRVPKLNDWAALALNCGARDGHPKAALMNAVLALLRTGVWPEEVAPYFGHHDLPGAGPNMLDCALYPKLHHGHCALACKYDGKGHRAVAICARFGYTDILRELLRTETFNGWTAIMAALSAAGAGHRDCLALLHQNGLQMTSNIAAAAASRGRLSTLMYTHENGCPLHGGMAISVASIGHLGCFEYIAQNTTERGDGVTLEACKGNHVAVLRAALAAGYPINAACMQVCARNGNLACMAALVEHGVEMTRQVMAVAVANKQDAVILYMHAHGCQLHAHLCAVAVKVTPHTTAYLVLLRGLGCKWGSSTLLAALAADNKVCFEYALRNGCRHSPAVTKKAQEMAEVSGNPWFLHCLWKYGRFG